MNKSNEDQLFGIQIVVTASLLNEPGNWYTVVKIVEKYSLGTWLALLSRGQELILGNYIFDSDRIIATIKCFFGARLSTKIENLAREHPNSNRMLMVTQDILGVLQQAAFMHAPEESPNDFASEEALDDTGRAVLIVAEILHGGHENHSIDEVVFEVSRQSQRVTRAKSFQVIARSFDQYQIGRDSQSEAVEWIRSEFKRVTGIELQNYFLGGFFVFARYGNRSVEEIVKEWLPIFPYSSVSVESELVGNYLQLSGGNIHQIRSLIELFEQGHPKQWTLIPLQKYPVVRFEQGACFSLHPTNVAHSCFDGVYYTILDFYRTLPDKSERDRAIQTLARSYGELVENYSEKLLKDIFQDRLIRLPISEEAGRKRCDFVVRYHNKIILIEVKTSRFTTPRYFACKSLVELRDLIENKVEVGTATNQLFQTIEDLRLNKVCHPELKGIDWTTTTIIPVIVSEEVLPSVPLIWENLYSKFDDILRSLDGGAGRVAHLRFLSIEDLFKILNVSHITDIGHLLSVWGQQENIRSNSLQNALLVLHHKYELSYELTEYEKIKAFALDRLNLSN